MFKRVPVLGDISPFWVSEGGLEPPSWWYITETVIHHRSKVARRRFPRPAIVAGVFIWPQIAARSAGAAVVVLGARALRVVTLALEGRSPA